MPRNKTEDLRNHLFAALEALADPEDSAVAIERAKATAMIAREINASAKNEISYLNLMAKHGQMPEQEKHQHLLGKGKTETEE